MNDYISAMPLPRYRETGDVPAQAPQEPETTQRPAVPVAPDPQTEPEPQTEDGQGA